MFFCTFENKLLYLRCSPRIADILESVFALSYYENVEVFKTEGYTNSTHFLYMYGWGVFYNPYLHITGVGHCIVYFSLGHSTTFIVIDENQPHTFFLS